MINSILIVQPYGGLLRHDNGAITRTLTFCKGLMKAGNSVHFLFFDIHSSSFQIYNQNLVFMHEYKCVSHYKYLALPRTIALSKIDQINLKDFLNAHLDENIIILSRYLEMFLVLKYFQIKILDLDDFPHLSFSDLNLKDLIKKMYYYIVFLKIILSRKPILTVTDIRTFKILSYFSVFKIKIIHICNIIV